MSPTSPVSSSSVAGPAQSGSLSTADCMFLLQVARKEITDTSLNAAMAVMTSKLNDQQALNKLLASLDGRANDMGHVHLTPDELDLLKRTGFDTDRSGNLIIGAHNEATGWKQDKLIMEATAWGTDPNRFFVPKDQLQAFKDGLGKQISSMSGSNEIQMLQVQRLMNSANEAMQAASSQLKSSHDIAMAIIRNLA